ncbi:cobaltochelatase subunit CobN [Gloeobacter violaceus]|uniref:Magnesium protoporphyrin IX chelatase subunit H n=1 Tax=Gloeobacter violaceus (strain ATCC 29082 / PCC 7421) TaxID=251221 RepID=Q7NG45_GLOVI|nr:cobaltochelatase subunit CobN [Gloeobacter violaceus]BAC91269.1 magnesium protoporphyrin IX chelatase subunit H [Gloeobacter violaceus PCC 7421]
MSVPRLVLISSATALGSLPEALRLLEAEGPLFEVEVFLTHRLQDRSLAAETVLASIAGARAVLFDLRGTPEQAVSLVQRARRESEGQAVAFIAVFAGDGAALGLLRMGDFVLQPGGYPPAASANGRVGGRHAANWQRCVQYWTHSGSENLANLLRFVAAEYAGVETQPAPPQIYPECGFIDPASGARYAGYGEYRTAHPPDPQRPTVAVLLYGGTTLAANLAGGGELFAALAEGANVVCFFADGIRTADALKAHFFEDGRPICDAIVSLLWFRLDGGPLGGDAQKTVNLLGALDVPYYVAITSHSREIACWEASKDGLSPVETLATVALAELDGAIDPVMLYGLDPAQQVAPVPGRGEHLARRILKRVALTRKANRHKRVAVVLFNYPPGEGTLGTASFLDVFASVENVLVQLRRAGYSLEVPKAGTLKDLLLGRGLLHNGGFVGSERTARHALRVPLATYLRWYEKLPASLRRDSEQVFGPPPGDLMVEGTDLLMAGIAFGNVLVAVQPSRGIHEDPAKLHHDESLPAHHQYIAFYRYLAEADGWGADAVVHVGTHGTFEFLPGKQVALGADSVPDALMGDLPHVYLYHVVNVSEGTIARRRSYAQLVSHASPTFVAAGLYGHLLELEELLAEYEEQLRVSPPRARAVLRQMVRISVEHAVPLAVDEAALQDTSELFDPAPYEAALEALHRELFALKRVAVPLGLHTFGHRLTGEALVDYLALVARYDRPEAPALPRLLALRSRLDYDRLLDRPGPELENLAHQARVVIERQVLGSDPRDGDLAESLVYLRWLADQVGCTDESAALIQALAGGYVEPGLGGDPVRTPSTYPTGRNTFQFDPTKLPTESACERGAEIAEATLRRYRAEHGGYPKAVGVILWGFETCKTLGETVGQILHYIGVRVDRGRGFAMKPEIVPLAVLARPRIDVTVNICGFFRDLFPHLVQLIDRAFEAVAGLAEPPEQNFVRRHTLESEGEAGVPRHGRLFGPPPGEYGNRLSSLIETGAWEAETDLARMYLNRTRYLYGQGACEAPEALERALGRVRLISQVRDSHEFEVTDLDHYYEFFGGMARASQLVGGSRPAVLIADTTGERIEVKTLPEAVRQGVTSRLFNPRWIDGMLAHGHQGAQQIADRVEYLLGLDATTASVGTATWGQVARRFVFDAAMRDRLIAANPYAAAEIARQLAQAHGRGYWQATDEERTHLETLYGQLEYRLEAAPCSN